MKINSHTPHSHSRASSPASGTASRPSLRENAAILAAVTGEFHRRLRQCVELLRSGDKVGAFFRSEFPPPGVERIARIIFSTGAESLRAQAAAHKFEVVRPDSALLKELRQGVAPFQNRDTLLETYRRSFRTGTLQQRLFLLRKLRVFAPGDSGLEHDQRELENLRLSEISSGARRAIETRDLKALELFHAELASPNWLVPPNEAMRLKIRHTLEQAEKERVAAEFRRQLKAAQNAADANNIPAATEALFRLRQLEPATLPLSPEERDQLAKIEHHVSYEQNRIAVEREFNEITASLRQMLEDQAPDERIEAALQRLQLLDRALPDDLEQRIRAWREYRSEMEARRKRLFRIAAVVLLLLAATGVWLGVRKIQENREQFRLHAQFEKALAAEDIATAEQLLPDLREPDAPSRLEKVKEAVRRRSERRRTLLEEVRAAIAEERSTAGAEDPLIELAMLDRTAEERSETADLKRRLDNVLERAYRASERQFLELQENFQSAAQEFDRALAAGNIDAARDILSRQRITIARINQLKLFNSPELVEEQRQLNKSFSDAEQRCSTERDRLLKRGSRIQELLYSFDPALLAAQWREFRNENPDDPEVAELQNLTAELTMANSLNKLRSLYDNARLTGTLPDVSGNAADKRNPYFLDLADLREIQQRRERGIRELDATLAELEKRAALCRVLLIRNPETGEIIELNNGRMTASTYGSDMAARAQLELEFDDAPTVRLEYRFDRGEKSDSDQLEVTIGVEKFAGEFLLPRRDIRNRAKHPLARFAERLRIKLSDLAPEQWENFLLEELEHVAKERAMSFQDRTEARRILITALARSAWPENAGLLKALNTLPEPVDTIKTGIIRGRENPPDPAPECRKWTEQNLFHIHLLETENQTIPFAAGGSLRENDSAAPQFYAADTTLPDGRLLLFDASGAPLEVGALHSGVAEWNADAARNLGRKNLLFLLPAENGKTPESAETLKQRATERGIENIRWPHARPLNRR